MKLFSVFIITLVTLVFILSSCSITPKGQYSKSKIERPYALPDDIASFTFGYSLKSSTSDSYNSVSVIDKNEKINETTSAPIIGLEQGVGKNISWIYPLGARWNFFESNKHILGVSANTYFFLSNFSLDYWYRLNRSISIRPYYKVRSLNLVLVEESLQGYGTEFVFQSHEGLAWDINFSLGKYTASSPFFEAIIEDLSETETYDSTIRGHFKMLNVGLQYAINNSWDLKFNTAFRKIETDSFDSSEV